MASDDAPYEPLTRLSPLCSKARGSLEESLNLKRTSTGAHARTVLHEGSLSLLELREVNRSVWDQVAELKGRAAQANHDVDMADLKLQNLQYEKNYFLREIRLARDYPPDKPIDLLSKAEFLKAAPAERRPAASEEADPHAFHLARLQHELDERKALCDARDKLLDERRNLEESIASRRAFLEGMGAQLASLIRISMPLQDLLAIPSARRVAEARHYHVLPEPMRRLVARAIAHRHTSLPALKVSVVGDLGSSSGSGKGLLLGGSGSGSGGGGGNGESGAPSSKRQKVGDDAGVGVAAAHGKTAQGAPPGGGGENGGAKKAKAVEEEAEDGAIEDEVVDEALRVHPLRVQLALPLSAPLRAGDEDGGVASVLSSAEAEEAGEVEGGDAASSGQRALRLEFCCMPMHGLLGVVASDPAAAAGAGAAASGGGGSSGSGRLLFGADGSGGGGRPEGAVIETSLFADLMADDAGDGLGGSAAATTMGAEMQKEALVTLLPAVPFKWAQLLATSSGAAATTLEAWEGEGGGAGGAGGAGGKGEGGEGGGAGSSDVFSVFGRVVEALGERVVAADAIALQLSRLSRMDPTLPAAATANAPPLPSPPSPPVSRLATWREVADAESELPPEARARLAEVPAWRLAGMHLYRGEIVRGEVVLGLTVQTAADFPRSPLRITLDWVKPKGVGPRRQPKGPPLGLAGLVHPAALHVAVGARGGVDDAALSQMEGELNHLQAEEYQALGGGGNIVFALSMSIQRAITLLDVYVETEGLGGGATAIRGTLCSRRVRGRDRQRPFVYDRKSGQFDQTAFGGGL